MIAARTRRSAALLTLLLAGGAFAVGPFTRQPLGQPLWIGSAADAGRGGAGLAVLDTTRVGERNPAALHAGRLTRFQLGFAVSRSTLDDGAVSETLSGGRLGSWALAFPLLWNDVSMGLSLRPLTEMDYHLGLHGFDDENRAYVSSRDGQGGLSQASLGFARAFADGRLRVGLETGLLFGSVLEEWKVYYPSSAPPYDTWIERRQSLTGFRGRLGLLWQAAPGLSAGLVWTPSFGGDLVVDVENKSNGVDAEISRERADQPGGLEFGLSASRGAWRGHLDLALSDWSGLAATTGAELVERPWAVAAGVELPRRDDFLAPWPRRVTWRAGMRVERQPVDWNAGSDLAPDLRELKAWTFTLGLGVPLRARGTWLDLALETGVVGDSGELGLEERFARLRAGLSARDLWFLRPKY